MPANSQHVRSYRKKLRERALDLIGSTCVWCGSTEVQCAHVQPTELSGMSGRGMDRRYRDVLRNPGKYRPMCAVHHRMYDSLVRLTLSEPVDEEPIPD